MRCEIADDGSPSHSAPASCEVCARTSAHLCKAPSNFWPAPQEPAGVADEPAVVCHLGFLFRLQHAEKIVGLRKSKFGVTKRRHRSERRSLFARQGSHGFVAVEERVKMIEVDSWGLFCVLDES